MIRGRLSLILSCSLLLLSSISVSSQDNLRTYADKIGMKLGTCVYYNAYRNDQTYSSVVKRDFNTLVAENEMKAASLQPNKGQFDFTKADDMVKFAEENNMKMRGHVLVWHSQNPNWLQSGTWTRETLLQAMKDHITGVLTHFKAKNKTVVEWDVVNEAFHNDATKGVLRTSFWQTKIGEDFIDSAFVYAHRVDPDILLFYNDYNTSNVNTKSTAIYEKCKKMLQNGIPIHGIGFQSHQTLEEYTPEFIASLKENFDRFAKLGLKIAVTELDIRITLPSDQTELKKQADYYREYMETALANPACRTFMIWGFTDAHSWVPGTFSGTGEALIYNSNYQAKPAFTSLLETLKAYKPEGVYPAGPNKSSSFNMLNSGRNSTTSLFDLRGVKVGTYSVISGNSSVSDQTKSLASKTIITQNGKQSAVFQNQH
jgi:endo-1,4-beta-xylanase